MKCIQSSRRLIYSMNADGFDRDSYFPKRRVSDLRERLVSLLVFCKLGAIKLNLTDIFLIVSSDWNSRGESNTQYIFLLNEENRNTSKMLT